MNYSLLFFSKFIKNVVMVLLVIAIAVQGAQGALVSLCGPLRQVNFFDPYLNERSTCFIGYLHYVKEGSSEVLRRSCVAVSGKERDIVVPVFLDGSEQCAYRLPQGFFFAPEVGIYDMQKNQYNCMMTDQVRRFRLVRNRKTLYEFDMSNAAGAAMMRLVAAENVHGDFFTLEPISRNDSIEDMPVEDPSGDPIFE